LELKGVSHLNSVATQKFGGWHGALAGGLQLEDFQSAFAGGDEKSICGIEHSAGTSN
jgi:hypothetical protein